MKGYLLTSITILIMLTGCQSSTGTKMTQKISQNTIVSSQQSDSTETQSNSLNTDDNNSSASAENTNINSEKTAIDAEIDALEADYRVGKISLDELKQKKSELELKKDNLYKSNDDNNSNIDSTSTNVTDNNTANTTTPENNNTFILGTTIDELLKQKRDIEIEEDYIDDQEDINEKQYKSGNITRDEFIQKEKQLSARDEELDILDDMVDDELERLGYDD